MWVDIEAKIEGMREREALTLYHGTSAGAIEMATLAGPPYELISLGALADKGVVPLGGEVTRGGFSIKGVNQDRISSAQSMERPLSYALGEHETRKLSSKAYIIEQQNVIQRVISRMNKQSNEFDEDGNLVWPTGAIGAYVQVLEFTFAMMRMRQMLSSSRAERILKIKFKAWLKLGRLEHVPLYKDILNWVRGVVRTTVREYQDLIDASKMSIEAVVDRFSSRKTSAKLATSMAEHYSRVGKFTQELKSVQHNILLLYAISLADPDTKAVMVERVQSRLDRFEPRVERIIRLAERAVDFTVDVPLSAQDFPFGLLNVPVIVEFVATQYAVNEDEISVFETVDLNQATIYFFGKHESILQEQSSWLPDGLYRTEHLSLVESEPHW